MFAYLMEIIDNPKIRIFVPPFAGFLFYGSWAFLINSHWLMPQNGNLSAAIKAAFTQGSYSFVVTLILAVSVEWLFVRLQSVPLRSFWVFTLSVLFLVLTSSTINIVAGTPNVLWTILPGLVVSSIYTVIYILALTKLNKVNH